MFCGELNIPKANKISINLVRMGCCDLFKSTLFDCSALDFGAQSHQISTLTMFLFHSYPLAGHLERHPSDSFCYIIHSKNVSFPLSRVAKAERYRWICDSSSAQSTIKWNSIFINFREKFVNSCFRLHSMNFIWICIIDRFKREKEREKKKTRVFEWRDVSFTIL